MIYELAAILSQSLKFAILEIGSKLLLPACIAASGV